MDLIYLFLYRLTGNETGWGEICYNFHSDFKPLMLKWNNQMNRIQRRSGNIEIKSKETPSDGSRIIILNQ